MRPAGKSPKATLNSWKEIAEHLERGVRTVQRWEHELNLPVRRLGKGKRSPVYALVGELDLWMITTGVLPKDTNPQAEPSNHKRGGKDGHLGILQEAVRLMSTTHELVQTLANASIRQRQQAQLLHERISAIKAKMR